MSQLCNIVQLMEKQMDEQGNTPVRCAPWLYKHELRKRIHQLSQYAKRKETATRVTVTEVEPVLQDDSVWYTCSFSEYKAAVQHRMSSNIRS